MRGVTTSSTTISIGELSRQSGVSSHTLRFYEKAGVLAQTTRSGNGHWCYRTNDLAWLAFVLRLKAMGMHLAEIKQYA
jgi:DNA-binding transcriptional MerR regulator